MADIEIKPLSPSSDIRASLSEMMIEAVAHGGSVSFMHPLPPEVANAFWEKSLAAAARGERIVLGAFDGDQLVGTVTLVLDLALNQPHRAEIVKMMTRISHRGQGVAKALLHAAEREAAWAFQGVTTDPALASEPLLLLDVGGGSTEFIVGQAEQKRFSASFPLGTVRLLEQLPHSDPPKPAELAACREWIKAFLQKEVRPQLEPALENMLQTVSKTNGRRRLRLVGTGGTATILA